MPKKPKSLGDWIKAGPKTPQKKLTEPQFNALFDEIFATRRKQKNQCQFIWTGSAAGLKKFKKTIAALKNYHAKETKN